MSLDVRTSGGFVRLALVLVSVIASTMSPAPAADQAPGGFVEADNTSVAHRATAFRLRGYSYVAKRQYDLALQDYDQSIRLNPADAVPYWNRGNLFNVDGRYDRAIEDYDQAITLNPGFNRLLGHDVSSWHASFPSKSKEKYLERIVWGVI